MNCDVKTELDMKWKC